MCFALRLKSFSKWQIFGDLENTPKCTRLNCFLAPRSRKDHLSSLSCWDGAEAARAMVSFSGYWKILKQHLMSHKILSSDLFNRWCVNPLQCFYKRNLPGPTRENQNVEQETGHVLRFKFVLCFCNVSVKWLFSCHANHFPPGQLGMVFSILILHSNPGDFLFLDKFTSTGFINNIYNMEASIFLKLSSKNQLTNRPINRE